MWCLHFGFKPQSNGSVKWTSQSSTLNPQSAALSSNIQGGLTATSPIGHYNLGGCFWDGENSLALGEMFSYNSANQSWYNLTLTMAEQHFIAGQAQYIPFYGASGVILFFWRFLAIWYECGLIRLVGSLGYHYWYMISKPTGFFKQSASNPPPPRAYFCSVAVGASNKNHMRCVYPPALNTTSTINSHWCSFIYGGSQDINNAPSPSLSRRASQRPHSYRSLPSNGWKFPIRAHLALGRPYLYNHR